MNNFIWRVIAKIVSQPVVAQWLIKQAKKTPYFHIRMPEDDTLYMERYWLFNPYDPDTGLRKIKFLPLSMRLHVIRRPDLDRHMHDHGWNFRTIVLNGWYREERPAFGQMQDQPRDLMTRKAGDTAKLKYGHFHRIAEVPEDGVVTLFIMWRKRGTWGFLVDGKKVHWETYLAQRSTNS